MTIPFYDKNAKHFFDRTVDADLTHLYTTFEQYLSDSAHILELGCGSGRDAKAFLERGYQVTASDGSETMVELAQEFLGQEVLHLPFDQINFDNEFDAVWANACLLHVPQDEMTDVFQKIVKSLKPSGVFYASFKHGKGSRVDDNGRIFTNFDDETIRELVTQIDSLKILETTTTEDSRPDHKGEFWLNVIMQKVES